MTKLAILFLIAVAVSAQFLRKEPVFTQEEEETLKLGKLLKKVAKVAVDIVSPVEEEEMIKINLKKIVSDAKQIVSDGKEIVDTVTGKKVEEEEMIKLGGLIKTVGKVIKALDSKEEEEMIKLGGLVKTVVKVVDAVTKKEEEEMIITKNLAKTISTKEEEEMLNLKKVVSDAKQIVQDGKEIVDTVTGKKVEEEEMIKLGGLIKTVVKVVDAVTKKEEEEMFSMTSKPVTVAPKVLTELIVKNPTEEEMIKLGGVIKTVGKVIKALDSKEEEELGLVGDAIKGAKKIIHNAVTDKDDGLVKL